MSNIIRFPQDQKPSNATQSRAWLDHFPAARRSGVANLFHCVVRTGVSTPALVVHEVRAAVQRRRQWNADSVRAAHYVAILTAMHTDYPGALAYAATVIGYKQLPEEERRRTKQARATQHREVYMQAQPPTDPQLRYLCTLGYTGATPANRLEASILIDTLLQTRKGPQP